MHLFFIYNQIVTESRRTAAIQKGTASFVRNIRGIPTIVIPKIPKRAITDKHMLWQTCHEPIILTAPDTLPVALNAFSFSFLFIFFFGGGVCAFQRTLEHHQVSNNIVKRTIYKNKDKKKGKNRENQLMIRLPAEVIFKDLNLPLCSTCNSPRA